MLHKPFPKIKRGLTKVDIAVKALPDALAMLKFYDFRWGLEVLIIYYSFFK